MPLSGAMLFVKDLPGMTGFYRDVLGMRPVEETRQPDWVEFHGDVQFSLHAIPAAIAAGISIDSPPRAREQSATHVRRAGCRGHAGLDRRDGAAALATSVGGVEAVDPEGNVFALRSGSTAVS